MTMKIRATILFYLLLLSYPLGIFSSTNTNKSSVQSLQSTSHLDSILTEEQYFTALDSADEIVFSNDFEAEILILLDEEQREAYESKSTLSQKKEYIKLYWRILNPNPLLEENEGVAAFLKRRTDARKEFPHNEPPYFDDRGKVYLKYGKPFRRHRELGGLNSVDLFKDAQIYRAVAKLYGRIPRKYKVKPNESWSYDQISTGTVFNFVRKDNYFREVESLKEALEVKNRRQLLWFWSDMINKRWDISIDVNSTIMYLEEFEQSLLDYVMSQGEFVASTRGSVERNYKPIIERYTTHDRDEKEMREELPTVVLTPTTIYNEINFINDVAQFQDLNGLTRLNISFLVPFKKQLETMLNDTLEIEYSCLLRDKLFQPVAETISLTKLPGKLIDLEYLPNAVGMTSLLTLPQNTELTMQVKDKLANQFGYSKQGITIRDFRGSRLMISDIQLLLAVTNNEQEQLLPLITKNDVTVAPYPYQKIHKSFPLMCYFEIYNLKTAGLKDEYELTLKVMSYKASVRSSEKKQRSNRKPEEIALSISHIRKIENDTVSELVGLDLSNLDKGLYILEVTVTDVMDKIHTVSIQKELEIVE